MSSPLSTSLTLRAALLLSLAAGRAGAGAGVAAGRRLAGGPPERHRAAVLLMVAVQALVAGGVTLHLLTQRFVYPLDRLTGQAQGLAALRPLPALAWPPRTTLRRWRASSTACASA
jgi:hypothetical protein